jgi:hypothetical protein
MNPRYARTTQEGSLLQDYFITLMMIPLAARQKKGLTAASGQPFFGAMIIPNAF